MNTDLKISVVIAIYNIEKYLPQCIDSVLQQSYNNIEVILVDDGSKDNSPFICDNYALRDKRVIVIHQKNGGLSEARNSGVKRASGDYIMFLDGDDFWDNVHAIERLVGRILITKADVLNFSYKKYFEDTGKEVPYFKEIEPMPVTCNDKEKQLQYLTKKNLYIASACNKLIKRNLFNDDLMFRAGIFSEDVEWCARLLLYGKSFDFVCENFYAYRQRSDSIRHTINEKKCMDLQQNIIDCILIAQNIGKELQESFYRYIVFSYGTFFLVQAQADKCPQQCLEHLKQYQWLLKYHGNNKKLFCLYLGCKIIGYDNLCKVIRILYKNH